MDHVQELELKAFILERVFNFQAMLQKLVQSIKRLVHDFVIFSLFIQNLNERSVDFLP